MRNTALHVGAASLAGLATLGLASPAHAATGNVRVSGYIHAPVGNPAQIHGRVNWWTDKNLGEIVVGARLQRYTRHGHWPIYWHSWDYIGRWKWQTVTAPGKNGTLAVWAYCRAGQVRIHVDKTVLIINGPIVTPHHTTANIAKMTVKHC